MNFEMAAELCQAGGIQVESVVINDDVAVKDSLYTAGRRGVGTTVLAEKICGAAAARGYDLGRVAALGRKVNDSGRSMGMALTSCTVPAAGKPNFELGDGDIEMGVGIHGEPGRQRMPLKAGQGTGRAHGGGHPGRPAVSRRRPRHCHGQRHGRDAPDRAVPRLPGTGAASCANGKSRSPRRLVGNYITSLDMAGCAITLLQADDELLSLWDDPVLTPALRWGI